MINHNGETLSLDTRSVDKVLQRIIPIDNAMMIRPKCMFAHRKSTDDRSEYKNSLCSNKFPELRWQCRSIYWTHLVGVTQICVVESSPPILKDLYFCGTTFYFPDGTVMMTSSNGSIFCVTSPLCGEFTGHPWIPLTEASDAELLMLSLICARTNDWANSRDAGDLRSHHAHYNVTTIVSFQC